MHYQDLKPVKFYKSLSNVKERYLNKCFLIEGQKAVNDLIKQHRSSIIEILVIEELAPNYRDLPVRVLTHKQISSISSNKTPQGVIALVSLPEKVTSPTLPESPGGHILLLEDIQDPGNVGTLLRTASAFDYSGAILTLKTADPFSPKVVQSSAGAVLSLWLRRTNNHLSMLKQLKAKGYCIVTADLSGNDDLAPLKNDKLILILGNESSGPGKEIMRISDHIVKIPINRQKADSLNVAICGAILIYLSRQNKNQNEFL